MGDALEEDLNLPTYAARTWGTQMHLWEELKNLWRGGLGLAFETWVLQIYKFVSSKQADEV